MTYSCSDLASAVSELLAAKGYRAHNGDASTGDTVDDGSGRDWWYTWAADGMSSYEVGETCTTALAVEASALAHYFANSAIPVHAHGACSEPSTLIEDLTAALVGLFPWAVGYIEKRRTPLHGAGEFARVARARALVELVLGRDEALRRLGAPRVRAGAARGQ